MRFRLLAGSLVKNGDVGIDVCVNSVCALPEFKSSSASCSCSMQEHQVSSLCWQLSNLIYTCSPCGGDAKL